MVRPELFKGRQQFSDTSASFDIGVQPGEHETFGQAVQEKLASGVPVVAVAAGGILDLVQEGDNGYLYPPGGLGDLRERVGRLAAQPVLRQRMGVAARASVQDRGWDRFGDLLIQISTSASCAG